MDELQEAARRVVRGDAAAFEPIVTTTSTRLVRFAARMLGNVSDAEDVVQEVYVKAFTSLTTGGLEPTALWGWLYRVTANASIDAMRSRARRPVMNDAVIEQTSSDLASADATMALLELSDLLGQLPEEHRAVLILKSLEGFSSAEIATMMNTSEGAVEQKLVRARAMLRQGKT